MKNHFSFFRNIAVTLSFSLLFLTGKSQVTIFSENFSGGIPGTWQNVDYTGTGAGIWQYKTGVQKTASGDSINSTTKSNGWVVFDSDGYGNDGKPEDAFLITSPFNCSAYSTVNLEFQQFFDAEFGGTCYVYYSTNGSNYSLLYSNAVTVANADTQQIDISSSVAGFDSVTIAFRWTGDWSWWWMLDDIKVTGTSIPSADFTADKTTICIGDTVFFTDQSTGTPTSRQWTFTGGTPSSSTATNPTVIYNTAGTYNVKLRVTNASGSDSITKTGYITVRNEFSSPFTEDFDGAVTGWTVSQSPTDGTTWTIDTSASGNGSSTASAFMNFFNYSSNADEIDNLISPSIDLSGLTNPVLTFKVAHRNYPNALYYDSLKVFVSVDCGITYSSALYSKGGPGLATSDTSSSSFVPDTSTDWRTESICLSSYTGNTILIRFEGKNGYGNNLYLDDVEVKELESANAGTDKTICASSGTLAGNAPTYSTGNWSLISGTATITTPSSPTSGITSVGLGANTLRWTLSVGSCTSMDNVIITRNTTSALVWTGAISTAWNNTGNWDLGVLPDLCSSVTIPGGTPFEPTISVAGAKCKNITINQTNGGILTISGSGTLTVND